MSHLTRKDMKRDEVREWMGVAFEWLALHGRAILIGVGAVAAAALLVLLAMFWLNRRGGKSQEALAAALRVYSAPVVAEGATPEDAENPSFADAAARQARAAELFAEVRSKFGGASAGRIASVYLGEIAAAEGDRDRARKLWQDFVDREKNHALAAVVRVDLLELRREAGETEAVAAELRRQVESGDGGLPPDTALFELGKTLEMQGDASAAREAFQQLIDEHPSSPHAAEARRRVPAAA